jgi:hypothetical protein
VSITRTVIKWHLKDQNIVGNVIKGSLIRIPDREKALDDVVGKWMGFSFEALGTYEARQKTAGNMYDYLIEKIYQKRSRDRN